MSDEHSAAAGYTPPPSPAYAPNPPRLERPRVPAPAPAPAGADAAEAGPAGPADAATAVRDAPPPSAGERAAKQGWQLLYVGLALVVVAVAASALVVLRSDGGDTATTFGRVAAVSGGVVVRPGGEGAGERLLEEGETVHAGWTVETTGDGTVALDLDGGGIVRFDAGATVSFTDLAVDPVAGEAAPPAGSLPTIQLTAGRAWLNPAGDTEAAAIEVHVPGAIVTSSGTPVALDCSASCSIEAPAGGGVVAIDGDAGTDIAANEVVTVAPSDAPTAALTEAPSTWAQQNLDADRKAGLPEVDVGDAAVGIMASAVLDGAYTIDLDVVGEPSGDAIPEALQYPAGQSYTLSLTADASACDPGPCRVPVVAADGASGSAQVTDGTVALSLSQPIDCYDEGHTAVVVPGIGTATVVATVEVTDAAHDGDRWRVASFDGAGTVGAMLDTACNPSDVLGTSSSRIAVTGR
ncbi:MAG: hypothetical protein JXA83_01190 [Acidimicrobiales bacterium]|nr:hypothetical protein [Acidimicrobiales bacterium]